MGEGRGAKSLKSHLQNAVRSLLNLDVFEEKAYWEITSLFGIKLLCRQNGGRSTLLMNFF
jgi:hypothetical protein